MDVDYIIIIYTVQEIFRDIQDILLKIKTIDRTKIARELLIKKQFTKKSIKLLIAKIKLLNEYKISDQFSIFRYSSIKYLVHVVYKYNTLGRGDIMIIG